MSQFHSLDRVLAQDDNFREFFTALTGGNADHFNGVNAAAASPAPVTNPPVNDPAPVVPDAAATVTDPTPALADPLLADHPGLATTLSANWTNSNLDAGPYWAMNSAWTIHSVSVNYDGDPNFSASGGAQAANPSTATNASTNLSPAADPPAATGSLPATRAAQDASSNMHHHNDGASVAHVTDAASFADHEPHAFEHVWN